MPHMISQSALDRYTASPSQTRTDAVKSLHETIRAVLGGEYETFLQGSYRNDTGVADINDVDIIALRTGLVSTHFTGVASTNSVPWTRIFADLQAALESAAQYRGKTQQGDKCIKVLTSINADVVPGVRIGTADADPVAVFSRREASERKNYPRQHYRIGVDKNYATNGAFKPSVRLFKHWARNWFVDPQTAPSFYLESLVHSRPNNEFALDAASAFVLLASGITKDVSRSSVVRTVAGDKDILVASEWNPDRFEVFKTQLNTSLGLAARAYSAKTSVEADRLWRSAFNES
jgi:hypothetical protein